MKLRALWFLHFVANISARIFRENMDRSVTRFTRTTRFVPEVKHKVCFLRPQEGPCRSKIPMYYFKHSIMGCAPFDWGGCQGNGNRFDTEKECLDYCVSKVGYKPPRPYWCQITFEYGTCFGEVTMYYYDYRYQVCKKALYSGCGGNGNKFHTRAECEAICLHGLGDTTPHAGQGTSDHGFSQVIVVDPVDTPRPRFVATTTKSGRGQDGKPGRGRDGESATPEKDDDPYKGEDGESGRRKNAEPIQGKSNGSELVQNILGE